MLSTVADSFDSDHWLIQLFTQPLRTGRIYPLIFCLHFCFFVPKHSKLNEFRFILIYDQLLKRNENIILHFFFAIYINSVCCRVMTHYVNIMPITLKIDEISDQINWQSLSSQNWNLDPYCTSIWFSSTTNNNFTFTFLLISIYIKTMNKIIYLFIFDRHYWFAQYIGFSCNRPVEY